MYKKQLKKKVLLVCDDDKCLIKMKEIYRKGKLVLDVGESGTCHICGKKDDRCNQFIVESFFDIKKEMRGK